MAVFKTQNRSPEKTLNFVTFSEFLAHPRVHHSICTIVVTATVTVAAAATVRDTIVIVAAAGVQAGREMLADTAA